ncbi:MAG TPA: hypothetical protein VFS88_04245 [Micavibrio sp.]|nr:hypothetical protein [Micavibrio sp.]
MALWNKNDDRFESSAKVVDGTLIISLPDALNPIVWRMELGSVKASALEVRPSNEATFMLSLKTPKGEVHDVAPFDSRERAVKALMRVSSALQNASGKMTIAPSLVTVPGVSTAQDVPSGPALSDTNSSPLKWLIALGCVVVVIFLFSKMSNLAQEYAVSKQTDGQPATSITGAPSGESGVPQSANDVLRGF